MGGAGATAGSRGELCTAVAASFPSLQFEIYPFRAKVVVELISASVRVVLEAALNCARNHLTDLLLPCIPRAWTRASSRTAVALCYFNIGVMVVDLHRSPGRQLPSPH